MRSKLLIGFFLCGFFLAFGQETSDAHTANNVESSDSVVDYKKAGAPLPAMRLAVPELSGTAPTRKKRELSLPDTRVVTEQDLDNGANLLVMMFNPTCGHCEEQADIFIQHISLFKKTKLVFMAGSQMLPYMDHFNRGRDMARFPETIIMGVDSAQFIEKTFLYESLPQINVYDGERRLLRSFTGLVPIDSLTRYVE